MSAEFVACMEDVLDLYAEPYDPKRPVVCFDETSRQLVAEKRSPIPARAGRRERFDYEYQRNGTRNLFMTCEPLAGWRHVAVTERRTMADFAHQMRWLADAAYPEAEKIRVVLDNLNTHKPGLPVRDLGAEGGQAGDPTVGVSLYSQARKLAQHGRD